MSIPSIYSIPGSIPVSTLSTETSARTATARDDNALAASDGDAVPAVEIDDVTGQPKPPRFPWLSRLSPSLEAAIQQRTAFTAAPILGDHLDQSA